MSVLVKGRQQGDNLGLRSLLFKSARCRASAKAIYKKSPLLSGQTENQNKNKKKKNIYNKLQH